MKEDKTPPIPPNSPYFGNDRLPFSFHFMEDFHPWTPEFSSYQKGIIAAVARCAWIDESKRINKEWHNQRHLQDFEHIEYDNSIEQAIDNAEAWRVWGLNESENS